MFDEISPSYDKLNHIMSGMQDKRWRRNTVSALLKQSPNYEKILDIASGSGDLAAEFMRLNPSEIYCADLSIEMLKINNSKLNSELKKHVSVLADAESLPFADDYFDLAGAAFGVRNFENLPKCLKEIYRVLKPGGKFLTIDMFKQEKKGIFQKLFGFYFKKIIPKLGNMISRSKYAYNYLFDSVDSFLNVNEYSEALQYAGFTITFKKNNFPGIINTIIAVK